MIERAIAIMRGVLTCANNGHDASGICCQCREAINEFIKEARASTSLTQSTAGNSGYAAALDICVDFLRGRGVSVTPAMVEELKQRLNAERHCA
jgi:hypothetical protein